MSLFLQYVHIHISVGLSTYESRCPRNQEVSMGSLEIGVSVVGELWLLGTEL